MLDYSSSHVGLGNRFLVYIYHSSVFLSQVLISNPEARKLLLTLKKTLVGSSLPILASYEDAKPGLITHGFIVCAREFGCIVKFYNDVKGLVPKNDPGIMPMTNPQEAFCEGQVSVG